MERNQTIDLLKFIFSLCIIGIHAQLFKGSIDVLYYVITMGIFRIAVPFFFVVSGYYFYQRLQNGRSVKDYFIKLFKTLIIFEMIEIIIFTPFVFPYVPNVFLYLWKIISTGLGGAYWYLSSLLISFIIMMPAWKKKKVWPWLIIGFVLYLLCMTNDSYGHLFIGTQIQKISMIHTQIWTWPQAGLCSSLFYLSIGAFIERYHFKGKYLNYIFVLSLIALLGESYFLQSHGALDGNSYFSLIILVPTLMLLCLKHPHCLWKTKRLGQMSLYIYMIHPVLLSSLQYVLPLPQGVIFVIVVVLCLLISYFLTRRKEHGNIGCC